MILHADTWRGAGSRPWWKEFLKKNLVVRPLFDAAFVPGSLGQEYLASLGLPVRQIWKGVYVVDNDYFARGAAAARDQSTEYRSRYGLPEHYFLCVSRLSSEKNLAGLIRAFAQYWAHGGAWHLVVAGTGPEEKTLRQMAATVAGDKIHFVGWQQYERLPVYYGLARIFILPSHIEPWGLVVNEAMAAGLPVLVSTACGCAPDWLLKFLARLVPRPDALIYLKNDPETIHVRKAERSVAEIARQAKICEALIALLPPAYTLHTAKSPEELVEKDIREIIITKLHQRNRHFRVS
ncbi:MAG: glycosyltransferase family 4 protein [Syntrophobacterales bacterium]|nr:glycosyltransferase family 4 protein [Syntrophobacterales bacterium]